MTDSRRRLKKYVDKNRYVSYLPMENAILKKWLEITKVEVYQRSSESLKSPGRLDAPEVDSTLI